LDQFTVLTGIFAIGGAVFGLIALVVYLVDRSRLTRRQDKLDNAGRMAAAGIAELERDYFDSADAKLSMLATTLKMIAQAVGMPTQISGVQTPRSFEEFMKETVFPGTCILDFEASTAVRQVYIVSRDLEPDLSNLVTRRVVHRNLRQGDTYYYYCEKNGHDRGNDLRRHIGAERDPEAGRVTIVELEGTSPIFGPGSRVLFDSPGSFPHPLYFEEIRLNREAERGTWWVRHQAREADLLERQLQRCLRTCIKDQPQEAGPPKSGGALADRTMSEDDEQTGGSEGISG
jgi:hypothetical protein